MKLHLIKLSGSMTVGLLAVMQLHAANFTTSTAADPGVDWTTIEAGWTSGVGAMAGNTYEVLSGGLVRSPRNQPASTVIFPGDSMQLDGGAAVRFKTSDVGTTTTYVFNGGGLILNGGQGQAGDNINLVVDGFVHIIADSSLTDTGPSGVLDTPGNPTTDSRNFVFTAALDGTGLLTLMNGKTSISNPASQGLPDFSFAGDNSSFSGGFNNVGGWLQIAGVNSLGSGNVAINGSPNNQALFSSTVDLVSAGTLTVGSASDPVNSGLLLAKNLSFGTVLINDIALTNGVYTVSQINARTGGANVTGSGTLTVGATLTAKNVTWAGNINSNWNTNTANWISGAIYTNYANGDFVRFNDMASTSAINLLTNVTPGSVVVSNNILPYLFSGNGGVAGGGGLTKQGTNTLTLSGTNIYGGATIIDKGTLLVNGKKIGTGSVTVNNNATLGGSGTIAGAITVQSGGVFAPGAGKVVAGVALVLSNNLTLASGSLTIMKVQTGSIKDQAIGSGVIIYGGTLTVTNMGGSLVAGDTFKMFAATSYGGSFSSVNLPTLSAGLLWNDTLASNGTVSVLPIVAPVVTNFPASSVIGTHATLNGQVVSAGNETPSVTLYYGPTDGGTSPSAWSNSIAMGLKNQSFNYVVTGLSTNTTYYYAAAAVNSAGTGWATPSESFNTLTIDPTSMPNTQIQYLSGTDRDHTVPWQFYMTGGGRSNNILTTIPVPSCWQTKGFGSYSYGNHTGNGTVSVANSTGQYATTFSVPASWAGERIFLVYEGVLTDTATVINGQPVGTLHQGGFFEFSYEVTPNVVVGASTNVLNVTVNELSANASVNNAEREGDYWNFSGIFRPVYLKAVPQAYIDRIAVDAKANGQITVNVFLDGISKNYTVNAYVTDTNNIQLGNTFSAPVFVGASNAMLSASLPTPNPWSAEFPNLYTLTVQLLDTNNVLIHTITNQIGFRTITFVNQRGYLVNAKKVVFRGICRHEFWPTDGRTSSRADSVLDIKLIKDMNFNAVRMTHYPPSKAFLEECDRLGLYVYDELPGWNQAYDNTIAPKVIREMVIRDVNYPSIIAWDNGNEDGWNTTVDNDSATSTNLYAVWDPQNRHVNRPRSTFNNVQDDHYPGYFSGNLGAGKIAYSATEILHGLFDGGGGASLTDYWDLMRTATNGIGMFLWVFADEGLVRDDLAGHPIDVQDQQAPDGVVGPFREKEASYYTYKAAYNPVQVTGPSLGGSFTGTLAVENRFDFTSLNQCTFDWQLGWFPDPTDPTNTFSTNALTGGLLVALDSGNFTGPNVAAGATGSLVLPGFPANGTNYDALRLTATDPFGNNLYTWTWPLHTPAQIRDRIMGAVTSGALVITAGTSATEIIVTNGPRVFHFNKTTGVLNSLTVSNQPVSFNNGPRPVAGSAWVVTSITNYSDGTNYYVGVNSLSSTTNAFLWTLRPDGWLKLNYQYYLTGSQSWMGVTFDYPSNNVIGMSWLGQGPYRDYKNRLAGQEVFVHAKGTNYTSTGRSILQQPSISPWVYPEFAGYYGQLNWATLQTAEQPITVLTPTTNLFFRVLTPPASGNANSDTTYPPGMVSLLHGISPIGDKFHAASSYGPSAQLNVATGLYTGEASFFFGAMPLLPAAPSGLSASAGAAKVILNWTAVSGATGYNLKNSTLNGGAYAIIASNLTSLTFTNTGLLNGTTYYYVVNAVNANGEGKSSSQASATTPILPPIFCRISPSGSNLIFSGTNGTPGKNYLVLMTTNLNLQLVGWKALATNVFDSGGGFNFTNPLSLSNPSQFYILQLK